VIETVKRIRALFLCLKASMPKEVVMTVVSDRTPTLNASLFEIQKALAFSIALVILVVGLFLKAQSCSDPNCGGSRVLGRRFCAHVFIGLFIEQLVPHGLDDCVWVLWWTMRLWSWRM
jgi:hypothetical protein